MINKTQKEKAELFHNLHHNGRMLVLPNIWDPLGALLMKSLNYPAIATASASVAYTNGYNDGEKIPFPELLTILKKITTSVDVPVTADIESGYAANNNQLFENIKLLLDTGIAGINFEDTNMKTNNLQSIEDQCNKIRLIRKASDESGIPLFINARTDVFLYPNNYPTLDEQTEELLKRGFAYKEAGADGFFPVLLKEEEVIIKLITQLKMPVNIVTVPGIPDLKTLSNIGVARVSLGPSLLKIAIRSMKELAIQLKDHKGLSLITENEITSDYLKTLVGKSK